MNPDHQEEQEITKQTFINTIGMMQAGSTYDRVGELCLELAQRFHKQELEKVLKESVKNIEEIAQWVIDNRYSKNESTKVSDFEMYNTIIDKAALVMVALKEELRLKDELMMKDCAWHSRKEEKKDKLLAEKEREISRLKSKAENGESLLQIARNNYDEMESLKDKQIQERREDAKQAFKAGSDMENYSTNWDIKWTYPTFEDYTKYKDSKKQ